MLRSSEQSDHVVFRSEQKQAHQRRKWLRKHAGDLDLDRKSGKTNVLNTDKVFKQTKTPEWMIKKAKRKKKTKANREKQKAILRQQKAYRKAKAQKLDDTSLTTAMGEEVSNLKFLDFHQAVGGKVVHDDIKDVGKEGGASTLSNSLLAELHKMTKDEYVASEFARKAGESGNKDDSSKVWEDNVDVAIHIKDEELEGDLHLDENGNAYEVLPELFHGFQHNIGTENKQQQQQQQQQQEQQHAIHETTTQDAVEEKEKQQQEKEMQNNMKLNINSLPETSLNSHLLPIIVTPGGTTLTKSEYIRRERRKRSDSFNPEPEFIPGTEEAIANHHYDPSKLQTLSYTEQRHLRNKKLMDSLDQPFDMTLPVKNMRVLKPENFSILYLSHCTVRDGRSPFFYHPEYQSRPKICCLGNGKPRHTFATVPMLCKVTDPVAHSNPTWGEWKVNRTTVIRDFVSREEACMFAAQNKIKNIFPGAVIPKLQKKNVSKPHASNNALMKGVKKKRLTKADKKALKLQAKKEAEEEAQRLADEKAAEDAAAEAAAERAKPAHVEVNLKINDYGVVKARTWHEDECVLVLENGRVLGIRRQDPCWVPASNFLPILEMEGRYILQANWARGKWRALNRDGESLIFKIP